MKLAFGDRTYNRKPVCYKLLRIEQEKIYHVDGVDSESYHLKACVP